MGLQFETQGTVEELDVTFSAPPQHIREEEVVPVVKSAIESIVNALGGYLSVSVNGSINPSSGETGDAINIYITSLTPPIAPNPAPAGGEVAPTPVGEEPKPIAEPPVVETPPAETPVVPTPGVPAEPAPVVETTSETGEVHSESEAPPVEQPVSEVPTSEAPVETPPAETAPSGEAASPVDIESPEEDAAEGGEQSN